MMTSPRPPLTFHLSIRIFASQFRIEGFCDRTEYDHSHCIFHRKKEFCIILCVIFEMQRVRIVRELMNEFFRPVFKIEILARCNDNILVFRQTSIAASVQVQGPDNPVARRRTDRGLIIQNPIKSFK